jgi:hypothetical protein
MTFGDFGAEQINKQTESVSALTYSLFQEYSRKLNPIVRIQKDNYGR